MSTTPDLDHVPLPAAPVVPRGRVVAASVGAVAVLAALFVAGWLPHRARAAEAAAASAAHTGGPRRVEVVKPRAAGASSALALPGSVEALRETGIWARASGYVRKWHVDIGDHVEKGQALCDLDTPELDQELAQADAERASKQASLEQARAGMTFSTAQAKRFEALAPQGLASQQDLDDKRSKAAVDQAMVRAAEAALRSTEANGRRLAELRSFARVVAPFDGIITARNVEEGTLVTAGTSGGQGLFRLAATSVVRVFVQIPQELAPSVRAGMAAKVRAREFPARAFEGQVTRTAGALDPASRTLRTEIQIPNPDGTLLAGMYAQATLELPAPHRALLVPSTAILADAKGTRVAVVGDDGKLRLVPVQIERDTGSETAIVGGLAGDERVVTNPGEDTVEGALVVPVERTSK